MGFLLNTIKETRLPTFMIDSDCIFVENFEKIINFDSDFVACARNRDGFSRHIGSFFGAINVDKSVEFIEKWITNINLLQETTDLKHCESPALSKTISENDYKIQEVPEQVISAVFPDDDSKRTIILAEDGTNYRTGVNLNDTL